MSTRRHTQYLSMAAFLFLTSAPLDGRDTWFFHDAVIVTHMGP